MLKKYYNKKLSVAYTFALQTLTSQSAKPIFFHCGIPQVERIEDDDEELEVIVSVVISAVTTSIMVVNTEALIANKIYLFLKIKVYNK